MGTSKNVASPDSPPWKMALAVLGRTDVPVLRQNREIWRSVQAERGPEAADDFSQPVLATACRLAAESSDVRISLHAFEEHLADQNKGGFAVEIAKRALARAVHGQQGAEGFRASFSRKPHRTMPPGTCRVLSERPIGSKRHRRQSRSNPASRRRRGQLSAPPERLWLTLMVGQNTLGAYSGS